MQRGHSAERYGPLPMLLHWVVVVLIIAQVALANVAEDLPDGIEKLAAISRHKSIGVLVLLLALVRIGWKLANPGPRLPAGLPAWQRRGAAASHGLLYLLLVLQPLSGWMMSSAKNYPVSFFGAFQLPGLVAPSEGAYEFAHEAHEILGTLLLVTALVHAAAALYHHFVLKDDVLRRMLPGSARK